MRDCISAKLVVWLSLSNHRVGLEVGDSVGEAVKASIQTSIPMPVAVLSRSEELHLSEPNQRGQKHQPHRQVRGLRGLEDGGQCSASAE